MKTKGRKKSKRVIDKRAYFGSTSVQKSKSKGSDINRFIRESHYSAMDNTGSYRSYEHNHFKKRKK